MDAAKLREVRGKLSNFETMTWNEILGSRNHFAARDRLCSEARERLETLRMDDIDELLSL